MELLALGCKRAGVSFQSEPEKSAHQVPMHPTEAGPIIAKAIFAMAAETCGRLAETISEFGGKISDAKLATALVDVVVVRLMLLCRCRLPERVSDAVADTFLMMLFARAREEFEAALPGIRGDLLPDKLVSTLEIYERCSGIISGDDQWPGTICGTFGIRTAELCGESRHSFLSRQISLALSASIRADMEVDPLASIVDKIDW